MQASHAAVSSGADTFSYGGASFLRRITFPSTSRAAPSTVSFRSLSRPISVRASASGGAVEKEAPSDLTFYELLGVNETGSLVEIKQAYKQLARKYHPDVSPPDGVKENIQRFIKVQEAYETLSDPRKRAMYDLDLARGIHRAFSARRRFEDFGRCNWWRTQWQSQLSELKRRCARREGGEQMSWGARMRRQRSESTMGC